MADETRYTLSGAEKVLARRECSQHGHCFDVVVEFGSDKPTGVFCSRCGETWAIALPSAEPVEVIPRAVADELAEALRGRPDDQNYGQFNVDGSPKKALRQTLALARYREEVGR